MIRMIQSNSAGHAKAYFSDALSKSDYYASDQELAGYWQGRLASRLGLSGATSKEDFFALCENRIPGYGGNLTPLNRENRRTGYDINFHCPKSVSVLHVFSQDDHILKAFQDSVTETMQQIEADAQTRIRKDGVYDDRRTGELVWGHFTHQTARPVEGYLPDPHLHSHCFVFNATWDDTEKRFKAGQFHDIKKNMPAYQARFHMALSRRLMDLGYEVRRTAKSFEVVGVPEKVTGLFSKRTDEIGRIAKEKGITDAVELADLGAKTRAKKQKGASMVELKAEWLKQVKALGEDGQESKTIRFAPDREKSTLTAQQCIDHALLHCFERASVVSDRHILESAYRHAIGADSVTADDIEKAFHADKRIIRVREKSRLLCTTKEVLAEEKRMVDLARQGQGKMKPIYSKLPVLPLEGQQASAVEHILTTANRVAIVRGVAGSGKSTLMSVALGQIEKAGLSVIVLAPSAEASRGKREDAGFENADTVAKFLVDKKMQESSKGHVIWVDEAGLLGTKDTLALLEIATRNNARLILGGDTRQHASVVRGDALRVLNTVAGIQTAEVSKIYRQQKAIYRAAVEDLSKGDIAAGFDKLLEMDAIREIDPLKVNAALVDDYLAAIKKGKDALIVAPTHAQGEAVTDEIRSRLRAGGKIGKKEVAALRLVNLNLTEAEKADCRNFSADQVVQFGQNVPGFRRGSVWRVKDVTDNRVSLVNPAGEEKTLPTTRSSDYDVFAQREIGLSKGDKIRITRNGVDKDNKRLDNGDTLDVVSVKKGKITLRNSTSKMSYTLDDKFGHLAHALCVTSYASQGKNVQEVFICQPAATFAATDAKQFYVSVSRGKEGVRIYTDDIEALLKYASEMGDRLSALELVGKHKGKERTETVRTRKQKELSQGFEKTKNSPNKDYDI